MNQHCICIVSTISVMYFFLPTEVLQVDIQLISVVEKIIQLGVMLLLEC